MSARLLDRVVLGVGGVVIVGVGAASAFAPDVFLASYDVVLPADAALRSELRSGGVLLLALGLLVGVGAFVPRLALVSAIVATIGYGAYALGRALSWVIDGDPGPGLLVAGLTELLLAAASGWVLLRLLRRR